MFHRFSAQTGCFEAGLSVQLPSFVIFAKNTTWAWRFALAFFSSKVYSFRFFGVVDFTGFKGVEPVLLEVDLAGVFLAGVLHEVPSPRDLRGVRCAAYCRDTKEIRFQNRKFQKEGTLQHAGCHS